MTNTTNTALQVTNFNFYGDELIALKDNATGEIYTSINLVLRGIGFTERQTKHIHKKWSEDIIINKGVLNFVLPTLSGEQETKCISQRKLPLALAKINITPKMKKKQPELYNKLLQYQDKCADVLAAVFIDNKSVNDVNLNDIMEKLNKLENNQKRTTSYVRSLEKSPWLRKTLNDIGLLQIYLQILHKRNLLSEELTPKKNEITFSWTIHLIIKQAELIDNSVNFSDYKDMYEIQTKQVYSQVLNAIEYFDETRELFDKTLDLMLKELKELTEYKLN